LVTAGHRPRDAGPAWATGTAAPRPADPRQASRPTANSASRTGARSAGRAPPDEPGLNPACRNPACPVARRLAMTPGTVHPGQQEYGHASPAPRSWKRPRCPRELAARRPRRYRILSYDPEAAERVRQLLSGRDDVVGRRMVGGLSFLVNGNMCCGITGTALMVRVGAEGRKQALRQPHVRPMQFAGRAMSGFICVEPDGFAADDALARWVQRGLDFVAGL